MLIADPDDNAARYKYRLVAPVRVDPLPSVVPVYASELHMSQSALELTAEVLDSGEAGGRLAQVKVPVPLAECRRTSAF